MSDHDVYNTQEIDDLADYGPSTATLAYYDRVPHRLELSEPADDEGLYRSAIVTYTADDSAPFMIRLLSRFGEVRLCAYDYTQFEGFSNITVPEEFDKNHETRLGEAIPEMARYLHDLLMFHRIDPPTCRYVAAGGK